MAFPFKPIHGLAALGAMVVIFGYPFLTEMALQRWETRSVATGFLLLLATTGAVRWTLVRPKLLPFLAQCGSALVLLGLAAIFNDPLYLLLFPAFVNLVLFMLCTKSLREGPSLVEQMARSIQPFLPEFAVGYCRKVTLLWAVFFLINVGLIGFLAFQSTGVLEESFWKLYTERIYFGVILGISIVEFFFRKLWFRHYNNSPLDRFLDAIFPAENTERGRRSRAYVTRLHKLGYGPKK